jgi:hypothetical protein
MTFIAAARIKLSVLSVYIRFEQIDNYAIGSLVTTINYRDPSSNSSNRRCYVLRDVPRALCLPNLTRVYVYLHYAIHVSA